MIERYQTKTMKRIWSEQHKFEAFLKVEIATSKARMETGLFSKEVFSKIQKAKFKIRDIKTFEETLKHDVIAFVEAIAKSIPKEKQWLHYGLTSTDVVDSANALLLKEANKYILKALNQLLSIVKEKAYLYKNTPIMGRTHGIHAEITSFGLKFCLWYNDLKRIKKNFQNARKEIEVCKMSGAVGHYQTSSPNFEKRVAEILKLNTTPISTQTLQRDRHANYMAQIALIGSQLEKMATEIRHLSRTEIREVQEYFSIDQKGSSAMPHKKNPIASENISGLARLLRGYMISSFENIALWHERDISHSSVERVILCDATSLIEYMLIRMSQVLKMLVVDEKQMQTNIDLTNGVIHAQRVLHLMIDHGMDRDQAYRRLQKLAECTRDTKQPFQDLVTSDLFILSIIDEKVLKDVFEPTYYLRHVDTIFENVFGKQK
jgi:adenylosuccinate lyase